MQRKIAAKSRELEVAFAELRETMDALILPLRVNAMLWRRLVLRSASNLPTTWLPLTKITSEFFLIDNPKFIQLYLKQLITFIILFFY